MCTYSPSGPPCIHSSVWRSIAMCAFIPNFTWRIYLSSSNHGAVVTFLTKSIGPSAVLSSTASRSLHSNMFSFPSFVYNASGRVGIFRNWHNPDLWDSFTIKRPHLPCGFAAIGSRFSSAAAYVIIRTNPGIIGCAVGIPAVDTGSASSFRSRVMPSSSPSISRVTLSPIFVILAFFALLYLPSYNFLRLLFIVCRSVLSPYPVLLFYHFSAWWPFVAFPRSQC